MITADMQQYIGTKLLKAFPLSRGSYNLYRGWIIPKGENPDDEGYLVQYQDGYESWSPKDQFEMAYRTTEAMTFGLAVEAMKMGMPVSRQGWNGNGQFVYLVPAASYPAQTGVAKHYFGEGSMVPYNAYFALKTVQGNVSTWVPSINDCLAEDWMIV
jgi:hypothetical protein